MATDNALSILAGISGGGTAGNSLLSVAPLSAAAPADADTTNTALPAGWLNAGWCSEAGLTEKFQESTTDILAFGTTVPVRTVIKSSIETFDVTMLETNQVTLALYNRIDLSTLPAVDATGKTSLDVGKPSLPHFQALFDVVDGANHIRFYLPNCAVTARIDQQVQSGAGIEYGITLTAYPNSNNVAIHKSYVLDALKAS